MSVPLVVRGLRYYWRAHLSVGLASAVGVAVLAGSLLVGDSTRGSLRDLALDRLGRVDHAVVSEGYFREQLADAFDEASPAILLQGVATHADTGARATRIEVAGVRDDFWSLGDIDVDWSAVGRSEGVINETLAEELGAVEGDTVLVRVPLPSAIPRETFLGERESTVSTLRVKIVAIVPATGLGRFRLAPTQLPSLNVFVPLSSLQRRLGRQDRANALLVAGDEADVSQRLAGAFDLADVGVSLRESEVSGELSVESEHVFLPPYLEDTATTLAIAKGKNPRVALTYLVNAIDATSGTVPYSMVAGFDDADIADDETLLSRWTANDLNVTVGDLVAFTYYTTGERGELAEETTMLTVAGIVEMDDPRVDRALTPTFPGISSAGEMGAWEAPFDIDHSRIETEDDDYWTSYGVTPKAFVSLETGRRLWSNRYGRSTSVRVAGVERDAFASELRERLNPESAGLALRHVRAEAVEASKGASDFGGLFIGFSLFLLVSAAMLIQMLFRLGVESRAKEYGLELAVGFTPKQAKRLMQSEGAIVAGSGSIFGLAFGVGYAWLMIAGLRTWWVGAVGTPFLNLHVSVATLIGGGVGGWAVAMFSIWLAARRLSKLPPRRLLSGRSDDDSAASTQRKYSLVVLIISALAGLAMTFAAPTQPASAQAGLFFGAGAMFMTAGLAQMARRFSATTKNRPERLSLTTLGFSATRRRPGRSLLVVALVACATFLIVAVGANRHTAHSSSEKASGAGGFLLFGESATPLYRALEDEDLFGGTEHQLRLRPGDDVSCLNLYRAARPRLLGVDDAFIDRGGFLFANSLAEDDEAKDNPWRLLREPLADGAIPVIGDYNTVIWLLHKGLGKDIVIDGRRYRFVALLSKSVFQGELIIHADALVDAYPDEDGWRFVAVEANEDAATSISAALEARYADEGMDVVKASDRLNALMAVENTYLSTFQSLGGLGLLLGTLGLALALMRNMIEREREFGLMRAVGFTSTRLLWLAVTENVLLLVAGMFIGAVCALVAVAPSLAQRAINVPWVSLCGVLLAVFAFGLTSTVVCAALALRRPALRALRGD